jgi:succinate dehydrogenase/fumarate reductase flavoprotein subunit
LANRFGLMPDPSPLGPTASDCDVVIIGSGAGGLSAAVVAAKLGLKVILLEASEWIGGTTAISGGMVWAPANPFVPDDQPKTARDYLDRISPETGYSDLRESFIAAAGEAVRFFRERTAVQLRPVTRYPDYYPNTQGAMPGGRVLEPEPFDGRELGDAFHWLRWPLPEFTLFGGMMLSRADIPHFRAVFRSIKSTWRVAQLMAAYGLQRLAHPRGTTLYLGNALVARLLRAALDAGVVIRRQSIAEKLIVEAGAVAGVTIRNDAGASEDIRARYGVVLATGGLGQDRELRQHLFPHMAREHSAAVPVSAPVGARLALAAGARIEGENENPAFWVPVSPFQRRNGEMARFPHTVTDRGKPGLIAVNTEGKRFVNEARSYHEFVLAMLREGAKAQPAWLICDSQFLRKYGLGAVRPMQWSVRHEIETGYLKKAATLAELAQKIGVPAETFESTVTDFNHHAVRGEDPEFGRGGDIYQLHLGDAAVKPNPCVAPIVKVPFYAIAVYPAELGASVGLKTDPMGRVMKADGLPLRGLYASGNDMHSVMLGSYPGPGITLGPALTFGYLAAKAIVQDGASQDAARRSSNSINAVRPSG